MQTRIGLGHGRMPLKWSTLESILVCGAHEERYVERERVGRKSASLHTGIRGAWNAC